MRVKLAKTAGFCMGVRRAMNAVLEAANKSEGTLYTLGPLVHNRQAMEMLAARNVQVVEDADTLQEGTVYIRAHGVTPEVRRRLERPGLEMIDLTCPHVRRAQRIVAQCAEKGYAVVIIGDAGHAEVTGLLGHAAGRGYVVSSREDVERLPPGLGRICVVAQTTQNSARFHEIVPLLRVRYPGAEVHDTVCSATDERQSEVRTLAHEVDAMIVVGGRHSANTVRLAEIARAEGVPTFHIETAAEIHGRDLLPFRTVGITAGASTPHWVFRDVVDKAERLLEKRSPLLRIPRSLLEFVVHAYLYIGAGAAAMTYAALRLLDIRPRPVYLLLSFLYVVSMHLLNRFTDRAAARMNDPRRMRLLERYAPLFVSGVILSALAALVLAYPLGTLPFLLVLLSLVAGVGYNVKLIPSPLARGLRFKAFKEIPGSKDLFMALAWALVSVLVPCLAERKAPYPAFLWVFAFVFVMVFVRSLAFDLKDQEGDRILGRETIPVVMGPRATRRLVAGCAALLAAIALADLYPGWSVLDGRLLLPVVLYVGVCLFLFFRRGGISRGLLFELAADAQFILTGLLAFLISGEGWS